MANRTKKASSAHFSVYGSPFHVESKYSLVTALGRGSYGIVCAADDKLAGKRVAIKKITPMAKDMVDAKHTLREMRILRYLSGHPNIIKLEDLHVNAKDDELYIIMELMDTDLHRIIQSSQPLSDAHFKYFLHQLLRGVRFLHTNGILHRDLKPGNILVTKNCDLRITDFGLARKSTTSVTFAEAVQSEVKRQPMTEHVVTRWYRPPELMLQPDGLYSGAVDMWSIGCIFAEMLGRQPLFPGKNFIHQLTLIFDVIGSPAPDEIAYIKSPQARKFLSSISNKKKVPFSKLFATASPEAVDLLEKMLVFDPSARCTVQEALSHPYLSNLEAKYTKTDPQVSVEFEFDFEQANFSRSQLKQLILKEVSSFKGEVARRKRELSLIPLPTTLSPSQPIASQPTSSRIPRIEKTNKVPAETMIAQAQQPPPPSPKVSARGDGTSRSENSEKSKSGGHKALPIAKAGSRRTDSAAHRQLTNSGAPAAAPIGGPARHTERIRLRMKPAVPKFHGKSLRQVRAQGVPIAPTAPARRRSEQYGGDDRSTDTKNNEKSNAEVDISGDRGQPPSYLETEKEISQPVTAIPGLAAELLVTRGQPEQCANVAVQETSGNSPCSTAEAKIDCSAAANDGKGANNERPEHEESPKIESPADNPQEDRTEGHRAGTKPDETLMANNPKASTASNPEYSECDKARSEQEPENSPKRQDNQRGGIEVPLETRKPTVAESTASQLVQAVKGENLQAVAFRSLIEAEPNKPEAVTNKPKPQAQAQRPAVRGRGARSKVTVPRSPKFSKMSWERSKIPAAAAMR